MPTQHTRLTILEKWREQTVDPCLKELREQLDDVQALAAEDTKLRELEQQRLELAEQANAITVKRIDLVEQTSAIHDRRIRTLARLVARREQRRRK